MSKTIKVIKEIELPAPPETHYLLPQEWEGKVKLQKEDLWYDATYGWSKTVGGMVWENFIAIARLRPYNPQGLSDDVFRKLPMDARALSDAELKRFEEMEGLVEGDEKLLRSSADDWIKGMHGQQIKVFAYATLRPEDYYLELSDTAFVKGKEKWKAEGFAKAKAALPQGYELITDPNDSCQEGDLVWMVVGWDKAAGLVGKSITYCAGLNAYVARSIAKLVPWTFETRPEEARWFRQIGDTHDVLMAIRWTRNTVVFDEEQSTYAVLLARYEWSPDGKTNWQPCGNYVAE